LGLAETYGTDPNCFWHSTENSEEPRKRAKILERKGVVAQGIPHHDTTRIRLVALVVRPLNKAKISQ
jgi:hypothetical protein